MAVVLVLQMQQLIQDLAVQVVVIQLILVAAVAALAVVQPMLQNMVQLAAAALEHILVMAALVIVQVIGLMHQVAVAELEFLDMD
jgi:hypothetical protein